MRGTRKSLEQTKSENYLNVTKNATSTIRVSHLLAAASVSALAMALPGPVGVYGTRAWAQALPPGCEDETGDTTANDGEIIECEGDPTTGELDPVSTNVDDLTLILGSETNGVQIARVPGLSAPGVQMGGNGAQSLTIRNANSTIAGDTNGVEVFVNSNSATQTNDLSIVSDGAITGEIDGINAQNAGTGTTTITTTNSVTGKSRDGISVYTNPIAGDITINASGVVSGAKDAIAVFSYSSGDIEISAGLLDADTGAGVRIDGGSATEDITIVLNDDVDAKTGGYVRHYGTGAL